MRRAAFVAAAALVVVLVFWATAGPPQPVANPSGSFAFAALGDAPYYPWEELQYRLVTREMDANDLSFVVHVGDIFWRPCTDAHYREALDRMNRSRHTVYYTPGDNEWTDCWEPGSGRFMPLERLARLREVFFADPRAESQSGSEDFPALRENLRWEHRGVVFATVHLVGSRNGAEAFPGRTAAEDDAVRARTEGAAAWLRTTFARAGTAPAVVVAFHADLPFAAPAGRVDRRPFEPFMTVLEEEADRFGGPVLVIHGDDHEYTVDQPVRAKNLTRLEVPGSPRVGWVRVVVTPGAREPFSFEERVVPRWKYW